MPAAEDDPQRDPQDQVVDLSRIEGRPALAPQARPAHEARPRSASPAGCRRYRPGRTSGSAAARASGRQDAPPGSSPPPSGCRERGEPSRLLNRRGRRRVAPSSRPAGAIAPVWRYMRRHADAEPLPRRDGQADPGGHGTGPGGRRGGQERLPRPGRQVDRRSRPHPARRVRGAQGGGGRAARAAGGAAKPATSASAPN